MVGIRPFSTVRLMRLGAQTSRAIAGAVPDLYRAGSLYRQRSRRLPASPAPKIPSTMPRHRQPSGSNTFPALRRDGLPTFLLLPLLPAPLLCFMLGCIPPRSRPCSCRPDRTPCRR